MDEQKTHLKASGSFVGRALGIVSGDFAEASLYTLAEMAVDERGLVHGSFTFGLADFSAMLAVNDPNVVLAAAEVKFLKPVVVGQKITARSRVVGVDGRRRRVQCEVSDEQSVKVFEGEFLCIVLNKHVLD